ncbi:glycosyltransferase family 39 protein [Microbispora sp. NBC_01389]|uniref:glycosyltransferase family 39 protein n=1 Tax=Microbispora sp. NBC_01389 TaxID=2903584 RepID=UPI003254C135
MTADVAVRRKEARSRPSARFPWLALVAAGYAAAQLALVTPLLGLGWDETVYLSQVDPRNPAAYFSAPRSRGISFLAAPVLAVTGSTPVIRIVLAVLSAVALYVAYRVWRPLLGPGRTALAALLFAGLWVTVLYGPQAMPNLWVALSAVAATGWFLRAQRPGASWDVLLGLGGAVAAATLFRFSDGVWLAAPLLAACGVVPAWRRPAPALAVAGGLAAGAAQWVAEAYVRWGGVGARLHASSATEGGMGLLHGLGRPPGAQGRRAGRQREHGKDQPPQRGRRVRQRDRAGAAQQGPVEAAPGVSPGPSARPPAGSSSRKPPCSAAPRPNPPRRSPTEAPHLPATPTRGGPTGSGAPATPPTCLNPATRSPYSLRCS